MYCACSGSTAVFELKRLMFGPVPLGAVHTVCLGVVWFSLFLQMSFDSLYFCFLLSCIEEGRFVFVWKSYCSSCTDLF